LTFGVRNPHFEQMRIFTASEKKLNQGFTMKKIVLLFCSLFLASALFAQAAAPEKKNSAISIGLLNAAAIVGVEYEYMFIDNLAFTAGAGFAGYNGGLNYHFANTTDSSFLHIGVNNTGFAPAASLQYAELSVNGRFFGWLEASIGGGYVLNYGDTYEKNYKDLMDQEIPVAMLTYSLAWYTAF